MSDGTRTGIIPAFSASYENARTAYGLSSALLLAWALIGVELDPAPVQSFKITLKSPQAVPYVLVALVAYFAFRLIIEWFQTELERRKRTASRVDFAVAHLLGASAVLLYFIQVLLHVQVANKPDSFAALDVGVFMGAALSMWERWRSQADWRILVGRALASLSLGLFLLLLFENGVNRALFTLPLGLLVGIAADRAVMRFARHLPQP
jgi:lipid-A-disaccharide synthase-like uncharacterized protein